MRKLFSLILTFSLLAACATPTPPPPTTASQATAAPDVRAATISELSGAVNGRARPDESLEPVSVGFQIKIGGEVRTGDNARARLDFSDESILRLSSNSSYTLQSITTAEDGSVLARVKLTAGRIWVSLFGGELEVETPLGVASVRGSFAVFTYDPGDPNDPTDDVLVLDCLEGDCGARGPNLNESLSNMERLVLGNNQTVLRFTLTGQDVQDFLSENPESQRVVATLTAAPPVNTNTPTTPPEPSATPQATATPTPVASSTPTLVIPTVVLPTATSVPPTAGPASTIPPNTPILGTHTVRQGEALFCIGRGYGVLPQAIASLNGFTVNAALSVGAVLQIPAVRWVSPPAGPVCGAQFTSPFAPTATPAPTANAAVPTATSGPTCPPNEFFDPVMNICRPSSVPATATNTPAPSGDTQGPSITGLNASPNPAGPQFEASCDVTFSATITDPAGVSLADVAWEAFDSDGFSLNVTGTIPMTLSPRTTDSYQALMSFELPSSATQVLWSVSALDGLGNVSTVTGPTLVIVGCFTLAQ